MKHPSPVHTLLRAFAGLLLLASIACNKKLPGELLCGCEPDHAADKKGNSSHRLAVCGTLDLPIDSTLTNAAIVSAYLGQVPWGTYDIPELGPTRTLGFFGSSAMEITSIGWHFNISATVKDLKGNLLVQIMDNKWFVYINNVGKYNYDDKGLEVFDKQGHISLSVDSKPPNSLSTSMTVEGIVPLADSTVAYYNSNRVVLPFPYGTPEENAFIDLYYQTFPIQPLFRYTGPNWQHARVTPGD